MLHPLSGEGGNEDNGGVGHIGQVPADILALVDERAAAKKAKDWARADAIRAELTEKGYVVEDTPKGPKVSRAK